MKPFDTSERVSRVEGMLETDVSPRDDSFRRLHMQRDRLYRALALSIGDAALAAEAVDEAMTRAYERWAKISRYDNPEAWVYRVALNWSRSVFRRRGREELWSDPPDRRVNDRAADLDVRTAVGGLPVKWRSVVIARYLLDWSTREAAEALGVPEATVKTRLRRALARMAADLGGEGL